mmetsp:Transcript_67197/g.118928  ORF Transcript_67197/g.118928 Transcript_67197/m.118928 type:complete len:95 (-) Transcript_67197:75-359(-)
MVQVALSVSNAVPGSRRHGHQNALSPPTAAASHHEPEELDESSDSLRLPASRCLFPSCPPSEAARSSPSSFRLSFSSFLSFFLFLFSFFSFFSF